MNNQALSKKLRQWLSQGKLKQTLEKLGEIADYLDDKEFADSIVMQTSRYNRNREKINKGVISREDARTEEARINQALLQYIHQLNDLPEMDISPGHSSRKAPEQNPAANKNNTINAQTNGGVFLQDVQGNVNINTGNSDSGSHSQEKEDYETRYKQMSRQEAEEELAHVNREIEQYERAQSQPSEGKSKQPLQVFISYAHEDKEMKDDLAEHLQGMVNEKLISLWQDGEIIPGEEWDEEIKKALRQADIVLFLVSVKFMNSDYIGKVELQETLERYKKDKVTLIPIIVRPCDWQSLSISKNHALPDGGNLSSNGMIRMRRI